MAGQWCYGNAAEDTTDNRGWLLGHFVSPIEDIRHSDDVEVKWGVHPPGDKRAEWTSGDQRTTLVLLVHGKFRVDLAHGSQLLSKEGDYVLWGPGVDHSWEALTESIAISVRWPSV